MGKSPFQPRPPFSLEQGIDYKKHEDYLSDEELINNSMALETEQDALVENKTEEIH